MIMGLKKNSRLVIKPIRSGRRVSIKENGGHLENGICLASYEIRIVVYSAFKYLHSIFFTLSALAGKPIEENGLSCMGFKSSN